jgi:L-fucose isomerase-like protein
LTNPRIGFVTCIHPIYNLPSIVQRRDQAAAGLRAAGCEVVLPETARDPQDSARIIAELKEADVDLLLFFFCTWVSEEITLSVAQEMENVPLLLWALPHLDLSVPMPSPMTGLTATGCNLTRAGRSYLHRVGAATPEQIAAVGKTARAAAAVRKLRRARFGIFGLPCPGMMDTACDDSLLHKHLGAATIRFGIDDVLRARDASSTEDARTLAGQLMERASRSEVPPETIAAQCRLLLGMKALVQQHRLDGFAVRCWPELRDQHEATICLAMAQLAEEGIVSACEADLSALVTSYILASLTGQPNCTLEITAYLEEKNALQMAHCGVAALSLADSSGAVIRGHMRTGAGALVESALKPGRVTIAKLLRPSESGTKLFISRGEALPADSGTRGTVAVVRVKPSPEQFLQTMLQHAVEHHLVLTYGDWTETLAEFALLAGLQPLP